MGLRPIFARQSWACQQFQFPTSRRSKRDGRLLKAPGQGLARSKHSGRYAAFGRHANYVGSYAQKAAAFWACVRFTRGASLRLATSLSSNARSFFLTKTRAASLGLATSLRAGIDKRYDGALFGNAGFGGERQKFFRSVVGVKGKVAPLACGAAPASPAAVHRTVLLMWAWS